MSASRLDKAYRMLVLSKFFTKGWGKPENLKKLFEFRKVVSDRRLCFPLVDPNHPIVITKEVDSKDTLLLEGHFLSPFNEYLPDLLPKEAKKAHFQIILPKKWESNHYKPVCLHLAGTGDHFFFRRRNLMAKPLLKGAGIGAILLENPFYGLRKPKDQVWSCLHNVSDIFVMGGCLILESVVLFHWCKRNGLGPLGITGISMGGHMGALLSPEVGEVILTEGNQQTPPKPMPMSASLDDVYKDPTYAAGQQFAKNFPDSLDGISKGTSQYKVEISVEDPKNTVIENNFMEKKTEGEQSDVLLEVLRESNLLHYAKYLDRNEREELALNPINIRDYLAFRSKAELPEKNNNQKDKEAQRQQASRFMCGIMDECTHLSNFSVPVDPDLIISVAAKDDAYVPRDGITDIRDIWKGAEVRYLNAGHVGAFLLHQKVFRTAIIDAFDKLKKKYYTNGTDHKSSQETF